MTDVSQPIPPFVAQYRERQARARAADAFIAEEMRDVCYTRFKDIAPRWERLFDGNHKQLLGAIERGPYITRREDFDGGLLWIYHADERAEDAYDALVAACIQRWEDGKQEHQQERNAYRGNTTNG